MARIWVDGCDGMVGIFDGWLDGCMVGLDG